MWRIAIKAAAVLTMSTSLVILSGCGKVVSNASHGGCPPAAPVADEFNGPAGDPPNPQLWSYEVKGGGLGAYTDSPRNASLDGNGNLAINALRETLVVPPHAPIPYTSARIHTLGKFELCYGNLSARIKIPGGQGIHPTFWLLGNNLVQVGWPTAGEIDIIDAANGTIAGSGLHAPFVDKADRAPKDVFDGFHEYSLHWEPDKIVIGMDGIDYATYTPASLLPFTRWGFNDHPMFVVLNIAVGGAIVGPPNDSTPFPATMLVDWMRYTPL
jgi:beta-glucanase (GH16 family)